MALATFVHVSDLHFGDVDPKTFDAAAPNLWAKCHWFDGLLGHSARALMALDAFFHNLRDAEDAQLIVTGDLTTVGHQKHFGMAERYLGAYLAPPDGNYWGLGATDWKERAVSGNHDHWPGRATVWGAAGPGFRATFPGHPFVGAPIRLSTGHSQVRRHRHRRRRRSARSSTVPRTRVLPQPAQPGCNGNGDAKPERSPRPTPPPFPRMYGKDTADGQIVTSRAGRLLVRSRYCDDVEWPHPCPGPAVLPADPKQPDDRRPRSWRWHDDPKGHDPVSVAGFVGSAAEAHPGAERLACTSASGPGRHPRLAHRNLFSTAERLC